MLDNLFQPLFKVSQNPNSNPILAQLLNIVTGFDCVDDESKQEVARDSDVPPPAGMRTVRPSVVLIFSVRSPSPDLRLYQDCSPSPDLRLYQGCTPSPDLRLYRLLPFS
jgi:hypothetical protein